MLSVRPACQNKSIDLRCKDLCSNNWHFWASLMERPDEGRWSPPKWHFSHHHHLHHHYWNCEFHSHFSHLGVLVIQMMDYSCHPDQTLAIHILSNYDGRERGMNKSGILRSSPGKSSYVIRMKWKSPEKWKWSFITPIRTTSWGILDQQLREPACVRSISLDKKKPWWWCADSE